MPVLQSWPVKIHQTFNYKLKQLKHGHGSLKPSARSLVCKQTLSYLGISQKQLWRAPAGSEMDLITHPQTITSTTHIHDGQGSRSVIL